MSAFLEQLYADFNQLIDTIRDSLPEFFLGLVLLFAFYILAGYFSRLLRSALNSRMDDPLLGVFLSKFLRLLFITAGILICLYIMGFSTLATGMWGTAGIGAFVLGFAFKDIGEHFLAGFVLAFKRPFGVGDFVTLNGQEGRVVALNIRDTQIKTADGKDIFIPNGSIIKTPVINYTVDGLLRHSLEFNLDYDVDFRQAEEIILKEAKNFMHFFAPNKTPEVALKNAGASSLVLELRYWLDAFDPKIKSVQIKKDIYYAIFTRLKDEGFYMPGDILEIKPHKSVEGLLIKP